MDQRVMDALDLESFQSLTIGNYSIPRFPSACTTDACVTIMQMGRESRLREIVREMDARIKWYKTALAKLESTPTAAALQPVIRTIEDARLTCEAYRTLALRCAGKIDDSASAPGERS